MLADADRVKETIRAAIRVLALKVVRITGDYARTAPAIAGPLHIDEVVVEVPPGDKIVATRRLNALGRVAYLAIEAVDVVLMSGRLTAIPDAIALSRANNFRQRSRRCRR